MEDVDIRKPLYLGVLPYGGDRYALFLNVTQEIERIVKDNVRKVKFDITSPTWARNVAEKKLGISKNDDWKKKAKEWYNSIAKKYMGKWDYKRTHPIFSKVQGKVDRYSTHFVYAKAPNKLITYDFLGNYNYAVTGMYVIGLWDSAEILILKFANEHFFGGITDKGDREAVALGIKNYKQYS